MDIYFSCTDIYVRGICGSNISALFGIGGNVEVVRVVVGVIYFSRDYMEIIRQ